MKALDDEGGPVHLCAFMHAIVQKAHAHNQRVEKVAVSKAFVGSICMAIGILWEDTKRDVWEVVGALGNGTLKAKKNKRRHRISRMYKRSLTHTARNAIGMGILNPKQILIGMNAALSHGPTQLLTMKERKNRRQRW